MKARLLIFGIFLLLFVVVLGVHAQAPSEQPSPKSDHTQEASVVELLSTKVTFENDGTSIQETTAHIHIQSDAGVQRFGLLTFQYQGATQTVEFDYVRVRKPDSTTVVTPPDNIQDLDAGITRSAPFYSDLREKHVAVRGLSTGDILEYLVRWRTTKPLVPGQFWHTYDFEHEETVLDERLQFNVPRDRPIKLKSLQTSPVITEESGRRVYTWKTSNIKDHSSDDPNRAVDAARGQLPPPDVQLSSFQTWDEVGKWYWGLQQERVQPSAEIRAKVTDLTKGTTDTTAKIHALYDYVSTRFRYIGVAFGIGRYQPHSAADVLSNQYGDCKDKHTLLASLLQGAGVTAYPALINSSHKLDPDVPSPAQFDHVITVVPQGKDYIWLDSTTEVGPFAYLVNVLRDKQALVIPGDKPAMLLTTPAELPFHSSLIFKVDAKLGDDGTLDAKMEHTSRGDSEVLLRSAFRQVQQSQWKDLVQQISYNIGFAGTVSDVGAASPEATSEPFHFNYTYNRKDYPDWTNHHISVPGLPFALPQLKEGEDHAKDPIWLGSPTEIVSHSRVEFPKGYAPELPVGSILDRDYAEYHSSYTREHGVLVTERRLLIKLPQVPAGERDDYKKFIKGVEDDVNRYILVSSSTASMETAPRNRFGTILQSAYQDLPDSDNPDALRLEKESITSMQSNDSDAAVNAMKKALAADVRFTRAWIMLGTIYMATHQTDPGLDAFHKAVNSNPAQPVSYKALGLALASANRRDEAIKVWQDLLKIAPEDPDANANLGLLFYRQKKYAEAVPFLEFVTELDPSRTEPLLRLGTSYMKMGDEAKGIAMFRKVLTLDSSASSLNGIAYELADSNAILPEALAYAEKAVRQQEDASQKVLLSVLTVEDLKGIQKIGSYWDTLGWVHFRMGNLDRAEKYLRASWQLTQDPTAADHLGQLYAQQQKRSEAIHIYRLGLAALESANSQGEHEEIQNHLALLLPGTNLSTGVDLHRGAPAGEELSSMRAVKLPRVVTGPANAEFFLLFGSDGKPQDVKFISGSDQLKSADKQIRAAVYPVSYPEGSAARLVRRAILSCSSLSGCEIVLYNPDSVNSIQ